MRKNGATGKPLRFYGILSSPEIKNISLYQNSDLRYLSPVPHPSGGAMRIVTFRWARDAMAAGWRSGDVHLGETPLADGEVVWSWRRDPGVYPARLCGHGNGDNKGRSPGRARSKP
jgi:hypothetical protein